MMLGGVRVVIGVWGLWVVGIDLLGVMGFGWGISVIFGVLSGVSLLGGLISILDKGIKVKKLECNFKKDIDRAWSKFTR
ncbi:hypothetical protein, partial [Staphylococcus aureus]|uniref:hypothetical protein n=1 Tax=Staphylococcus aureus TaxID=1280 RepID=UPI00164323FA